MTEREAFEAAFQKTAIYPQKDAFLWANTEKSPGGFYLINVVEESWNLWQASRLQALEEAAKECEERASAYRVPRAPGWVEVEHECTQCAAAIRSLTSPIGDKP